MIIAFGERFGKRARQHGRARRVLFIAKPQNSPRDTALLIGQHNDATGIRLPPVGLDPGALFPRQAFEIVFQVLRGRGPYGFAFGARPGAQKTSGQGL